MPSRTSRGGGITENLNRALAPDVDAVVDRASSPQGYAMGWGYAARHSLHRARRAGLTASEACKTFNMGVGLMIICPAEEEASVMAALEALGEHPFHVGTCVEGTGKVVYTDER